MEIKQIRIIFLLLYCLCFPLHATVTIGTPVFAPPFIVNMPPTAIHGFDVELMNMICTDLNWQCKFVPIQGNLFAALDQNQVDFIIGGITITPERRLLYLFSTPYLPSKAGFIVLSESSIKLVTDLKNKRVAVLQERVYETFLTQNFPIPIKIITYALYSDLVLAMKNVEVDAAFINYYSALYISHQYEGIRTLDKAIDLGEGIGIATTFNNRDLIEQINQLLIKYQSNGSFVRLYNYYFQFFIQ